MLRDRTQIGGSSPSAAAPSAYTEAMSALAGGIVMVTSWLHGRPWGMTVSAFASVSADPPTIVVSLRSDTASARTIDATGSFGVSILGRRHRTVARHGSAPGATKFLERFSDPRADTLSPEVAGALAHLDCEVAERVEVADHTIFVARVHNVRLGIDDEPLVYFRRTYRTLAPCTSPSTRRRIPCLSN